VPGVTAFYGLYQITFKLISTDPCGSQGPPGTLNISGSPDGSNLVVDVGESGGIFEYHFGQMNTDGTFSAIAVTPQSYPLDIIVDPNHLVQNGTNIQGQVVGNNVTGRQTIFVAPQQCTATDPNSHTIIIDVSGSR